MFIFSQRKFAEIIYFNVKSVFNNSILKKVLSFLFPHDNPLDLFSRGHVQITLT